MKLIFRSINLLAFLFLAFSAFAQKYKTASDTIKLNKEYLELTNDITELQVKLDKSVADLQGYQSKAASANEDAISSATESSDQANKATNGTLRDAKKAKRKAKKAYGEARDSRSADNKVKSQEKKISGYRSDIEKKQKRLNALDEMRAAIAGKMTN